MAETVLAKLAVQIAANSAEFTKGIQQAQSELKGFSSVTQGISKSLQAFGIGFGAYQIVNGLRDAIGVMSAFESRMSEVRAITGATGQEFESLKNNALELGRSTLYSAEQVASLQIAYGRLGFTTKEIVAATKATIDLATATGEDLAKSADIVGSTIRAFGLSANDTVKVTDIMASSFNKTALGLDNFGEAIKYVAPVAAQANISFEETTALLGTLADAGIRGSSAGTALRKIITDLGGESGTLSEKLKKLADRGLTGAQALDEVGRTAYASLLILSKATEKTEGLTEAFHNATGETAKMAAAMSDNLTGDVTKLSNAWDGLLISLGNTAPFRDAAQGLESLLKLFQGLPNERLLFEGLAASITTGFNLDKAIINVANYRKELGKPIDIGQFETIIQKYNLTKEQVEELNKALVAVNKNISDDEKAMKLFNEFAQRNGYKDLTKAADDFIKKLNEVAFAFRVEKGEISKVNPDGAFNKERDDLEIKIAQYERAISVITAYKESLAGSGKAPTIATPPPGLIETLEARLKDLRALQQSAFSTDQLQKYDAEIAQITKRIEVLKNLKGFKFDVAEFDKSFGTLEEQNKKFNDSVTDGSAVFKGLKDNMEQVQEEAYKVGMSLMEAKGEFLDWEPQYREIQRVKDIMQSLDQQIKSLIAGAIADLGFALGEALGGNNAKFGKDLLKAAVNFAKQFGQVLISTGLAIEAFDTAAETGNGYALIAAGAALVIAAGVASSVLKSASLSSGGSSTSSPSTRPAVSYNYGRAGESQDSRGIIATTVIRGQDLYVVLQNYNNNNKFTKSING